MSPMSREKLRAHKALLLKKYGQRPWFRGVGIAPSGGDLVLRLNVDDRELGDDDIPTEFESCPIEVVFTHGYEKR